MKGRLLIPLKLGRDTTLFNKMRMFMDKASMDEVNAALEEQETNETEEESSTPEEEEVQEETKEETKEPLKPQGVPQSRVDQIVAEREQVKAEKAVLEEQLKSVKDLERMGYKIEDIKEYVNSTGNSTELDSARSKREVEELKKTVSSLKENSELNQAIADNPNIKSFSNGILALKRTYPNKSVSQIYEDYFAKAVPTKKKIKVETGRGSIEKSFESGMTFDKFDNLSLKDKAKYLDKIGA